MKYYEDLPKGCPPEDANAANGSYYRLGSIPPDDSDFWSHRRKFPAKSFQVSECVARSLSVFGTLDAAMHLRRLLPAMREKPIFELALTPTYGKAMQTGSNPNHYSWWRSAAFDIQTINNIEL